MIEQVVVTGASSGIGAACLLAFRELGGVKTIGLDVLESSEADQHFQIDLAESDCGQRLADFIRGQPIDGLVNSAGIGLDKPAVDTSVTEFDRLIAVNLRAPLLLSVAIQKMLAARRGFVVNVASVHSVATSPLVAAYAASKGGLTAMTRALATEWAPDIRVNAVLPGAIDTAMLRAGLSRMGSSLEDLASRHPLGRVGSPKNVADAVVFLALSDFTTGSTLTIDGGATARLSTE